MRTIQKLSAFVLFILCATALIAQDYRGVEFGFTISNEKGRSQYLVAGIREGATSGIDPSYEEYELPPPPPVEIFDARMASTPGKSQLGSGTIRDYRAVASTTQPFTEKYTISYQGGEGVTSVKIEWVKPMPSRITKVTVDGQDISTLNDIVTQFAQGLVIVEITFDYKPLSFTANPNSLSFTANNIDPLPAKTFELIPQGETDAAWDVSVDVEWLDISPMTGIGQETIEVAVNTYNFSSGAYNAIISVRSPVYPVKLDIPVTLTFTVGVDEVIAPTGMMLLQNYPNPFKPATAIDLDLGERALWSVTPSLKVYDSNGREIADLSHCLARITGIQTVIFNAENLPAGVYTYSLTHTGYTLNRSMILLK